MAREIQTDRPQTERQTDIAYQEWLATYRHKLNDDYARFRRLETRWSWIRLISFAAGLAAVVLLRRHLLFAGTAGVLGALAFAGAVLRHVAWENRRAFAERALTIAAESLHGSTRRDAPARAWQRPLDSQEGSAGVPPVVDAGPAWPLTDQERDDLDIYGPPLGVFGLLNRTSTSLGARKLRDVLDSPTVSPEHIRQRQDAVRWLASHHQPRLEMMATFVLLRGQDRHLDRFVRLLHETDSPPRSALSTGLKLWSPISGLIFLSAILHIMNGEYQWIRGLVALLLANGILL
ncbi:MAG: hypothetical protein ACM3VT_06090, partial [Solirubrobacterales bacterium]